MVEVFVVFLDQCFFEELVDRYLVFFVQCVGGGIDVLVVVIQGFYFCGFVVFYLNGIEVVGYWFFEVSGFGFICMFNVILGCIIFIVGYICVWLIVNEWCVKFLSIFFIVGVWLFGFNDCLFGRVEERVNVIVNMFQSLEFFLFKRCIIVIFLVVGVFIGIQVVDELFIDYIVIY